MTLRLHDDELRIDVELVRALVDRHFPRLASRPLRRLPASGSTNALFRLGEDLLVRLPRQPGGSAGIDKEARWLPLIGPSLPAPVPRIVAVAGPDPEYPQRWSLVRWLDGDVPDDPDLQERDRADLARDLAAVLAALREIDVPPAALSDPELRLYRGRPLTTRDEATRRVIARCREIADLDLDLDAAARVWEHAMTLPAVPADPRWYHGDLFAENLLVRDGRLSAVLDFGELAVGDPTVDLIVAWEVLDRAGREVFARALGVDEASWLRGRAWALSLALGAFPYYWHTMPGRCASKLAVVRRVLSDALKTGQA